MPYMFDTLRPGDDDSLILLLSFDEYDDCFESDARLEMSDTTSKIKHIVLLFRFHDEC